jgi:hypothetical protein
MISDTEESSTARVIVVIDDKDHALKQILHELPRVPKKNLVFRHFDSIGAFRESGVGHTFAVFLDFFLSKDRDYGTSVIPELRCDHLVCFSSMKRMSDHMRQAALEHDHHRIGQVYSVQKIKGSLGNPELRKVLESILR